MGRTRWVLLILLVGGLAGQATHPCVPWFTIRAYSNSRFWQPLAKTTDEAWGPAARGGRDEDVVFAGMGCSRGQGMKRVGCAYAALAEWAQERRQVVWEDPREGGSARRLADVRQAMEEARAARLSPEQAEELRLVEGKVELRAAEMGKARLPNVKARLEAFLAGARVPRLASEARGWLARVHYLLGEPHPAARIYLRELADPDSVFDENSLLLSLGLVFPYNGSSASLADHLEEYFDHPRHALFVVNLVTNPAYQDGRDHAAREEVGRKVLAALERHETLFRHGADSEALALALMRAALYKGDLDQARAYAARLPAEATRRAGPEFHWTASAADVLSGREAEAEAHLRAVAESRSAPRHYRAAAGQGLIGVYLRLGRMPDAIQTALRLGAGDRTDPAGDPSRPSFEVQFSDGWLLDLPYLIDVQAADDDLRETLARLGSKRALRIGPKSWGPAGPERSAQDVVAYALAVRHARREEYAEAARLFTRVQAGPRARRMKEAARLHAAATETRGSPSARLEGRYRYAAFLADHSTQVFFNDMLWPGYQRYALTREERGFLDGQEERWRAYRLLDALAQEAGPTPLGRRAAGKALEALDGINTERFGRESDVRAARKRLVAWLRQGRG